MRLFLVCAAVLELSIVRATAADVTRAGTFDGGPFAGVTRIRMNGGVEPGDARRLAAALEGLDEAVISFNSTGGDYREGLLIAKLISDRLIGTVVENGSRCLSACAVAFLGGAEAIELVGGNGEHRAVGAQGKLAFHAPFINVGTGNVSHESVEAAYDHAIRTVTDFVRESTALRISPGVAADMMTPQRTGLYYVDTVRELQRVGVDFLDARPIDTLTESMVRNLCINVWVWRHATDDSWDRVSNEMSLTQELLGWAHPRVFDVGNGTTRVLLPFKTDVVYNTYLACIVDYRKWSDPAVSGGYLSFTTVDDLMERAKIHATDTFLRQEDYAAVLDLGRLGSWALLPESTTLPDINDGLQRYRDTEPPLTPNM